MNSEISGQLMMSATMSELIEGVEIKEKTLVVKDLDQLNNMTRLTEKFSEAQWNEFNHWGDPKQFVSMRNTSIQLSDAYALVNSQESYDEFMTKYRGIVEITEKKSIDVQDYFPMYAGFLNTDGEIYIGESLFKFTPSRVYQIFDGDRSKLATAIRTPESNERLGIHVYDISPAESRTSCPETFVSYFCHVGSPQSHRLDNVYQLYFNSFVACQNYGCWDLSNTLSCYIKSEKRGFLGLWYRHRTPITWSIGWGAQGDPAKTPYEAGGTGWTGSSGQSEINWSTAMGQMYFSIPTIDGGYKYKFDYLYPSASTAEISSCSFGCQ